MNQYEQLCREPTLVTPNAEAPLYPAESFNPIREFEVHAFNPAHTQEEDPPSKSDAATLKVMLKDLFTHAPGVVLSNGADMNPKPVNWLWRGWLASGKVHLLAGEPGLGKTTMAMSLAAAFTTGGQLPDKSLCEQGSVLIWSGEDDPEDTLLPRLLAAGADRSRCYFVSGTNTDGGLRSFDPGRDLPALVEKARHIKDLRLIVIDPMVAAVNGDTNKHGDVRRGLQTLVDLANDLGAAVLGISHLSKGSQLADPAQRVLGSVAFVAVARMVMVASKVKNADGTERRILARAKSNLGADGSGFEYQIDESEPIPGIMASFISWGAPVEGSARELLTDASSDVENQSSAIREASDFIVNQLSGGPMPVKELELLASQSGISIRTLRRASDELKVVKKKTPKYTVWSLKETPETIAEVQDARANQLSQDGQVVQAVQPDLDMPTPIDVEQDGQEPRPAGVEQIGQVGQVGHVQPGSGVV